MDSVTIARHKLDKLTKHTNKKLYELKYSSDEYRELNNEVYDVVLTACIKKRIEFPLIKKSNKVYLDTDNKNLYSILHKLADECNIILDYDSLK